MRAKRALHSTDISTGKKQIERTVTINAPRTAVWAVLSDARQLAQWVPAVDEVTGCSTTGEAVGTVRTCRANLAGKPGTIVERCIEFQPIHRIAFVVDNDSFGMGRMFNHYGFSMTLLEPSPNTTTVTLETRYTPRNPIYATLNIVMLRRQFGKVCDGIVAGLKSHVEREPGQPAREA